jgi:general secretion pathway protein N
LLAGLGTPWNTLQLGGSLRLSARELRLQWVQGRWLQSGELHLDLLNLSSRVSTVAPLGSYRLSLSADAGTPGVSTLRLSTLEGALQLSGAGTLSSGGKSRFTGEAGAAPGREEALNNLLNIIGRRQGARSVLTIG